MSTPESTSPQPEFSDRFATPRADQNHPEQLAGVSLERRQAELITLLNPLRRTDTGLASRYELAKEHFVTGEPDERLRAVGEVFIMAHEALGAERKLAKVRQMESAMHRSEFLEKTPWKERKRLKGETRKLHGELRDELIEFNHAGRRLVETAGAELGRQGLVKLVTDGAHGNRRWAERMVAGWIAEHAISRTLAETPGVVAVTEGTVAQDREGGDLVIQLLNGSERLVDAKSEPGTAMHVGNYDGQLTISLDYDYIGNDCLLKPEYAASFRGKLADRIGPLAA